MKWIALALLCLGVYLVKGAILPKSFANGSFLLGVIGLLCVIAGLLAFLILIFLAL